MTKTIHLRVTFYTIIQIIEDCRQYMLASDAIATTVIKERAEQRETSGNRPLPHTLDSESDASEENDKVSGSESVE